jgi:hypothetical protein
MGVIAPMADRLGLISLARDEFPEFLLWHQRPRLNPDSWYGQSSYKAGRSLIVYVSCVFLYPVDHYREYVGPPYAPSVEISGSAGNEIPADMLRDLSELREVQRLQIDAGVNAELIRVVSGWNDMDELKLPHIRAEVRDVSELRQLRGMRAVELGFERELLGSDVSALVDCRMLKNVSILRLGGMESSVDREVAKLAELPDLEVLIVCPYDGEKVVGAEMFKEAGEAATRSKTLSNLVLLPWKPSDEVCFELAKVKTLESIAASDMSEKAFNHLASQPQVKYVRLWDSTLSKEQIEMIQSRYPAKGLFAYRGKGRR